MSDATAGGQQKPICAICFEDLKPIAEDLQTIPLCGHVFHELCIQQWLEYCPKGRKPTCPICKQSCCPQSLTRLYFQSTGDQTQVLNPSQRDSLEADAGALAEEVRRLEAKVLAMATTFENQQVHIKNVNDELSTWKELAKEEASRNKEIKREKECIEQFLNVKVEELSRKSIECSKLQERSLGLAKELAALKLATDLNLGEEEMVKLASLGHGNNPENAIEVLKKSLALRNKSYKELMAQCNILGRSDTRTRKKLDQAKEKIQKLRTRLRELEKALEEKENEVLRNLKASYEGQAGNSIEALAKPEQTSFLKSSTDHLNRTINCSELQNDSASLAYKGNTGGMDIGLDSCFVDEDCLMLSPDLNEHITAASDRQKLSMSAQRVATFVNAETSTYQHNGLADGSWSSGINMKNDEKGIPERNTERNPSHLASSTWTSEKLSVDEVSNHTSPITVKKEAPVYDTAACAGDPCFPGGLFGYESANRTIGKWCRSSSLKMQTSTNNGDLIAVGADGRGGRVKVLRDHDQSLDSKAKTLWPKKHKNAAKQNGQFHIEHFFGKPKS